MYINGFFSRDVPVMYWHFSCHPCLHEKTEKLSSDPCRRREGGGEEGDIKTIRLLDPREGEGN